MPSGMCYCPRPVSVLLLADAASSTVASLYESLHSVNVLHNDVERRHVRGTHDRWRLIDFESSIKDAPNEDLRAEGLYVFHLLEGRC